jgi:hypothetical protein
MDRGRSGGAGVLHPRRALEAQSRFALHHERGRELLALEAGIDLADEHLVDVRRGNAGVRQRRADHLSDQRLHIDAILPPERRVAPADDACGHGSELLGMDGFGR